MQNRILVVFIVGLLFLGGLFFFILASQNSKFVHPIQEIPLGTEFIIQFPNYNDFSKSYKNTLEFATVKGFLWDSFSDFYIQSFDSVLIHFQIKEKRPCVFSAFRNGIGKYDWLLVGGCFNYSDQTFKEYLFTHFHDVHVRKYNGCILFTSTLERENKSIELYFSIADNNLIMSSSEVLVESGIRQSVSDDKIANDKYFKEIYTTSGKNVVANLFMNYSRFSSSNEDAGILSFGTRPGYWGALDLVIKDKIMFFNGFTRMDSTFALSQMILDQNPVKFSAYRVLPFSTVSISSISCSRKMDFKKDLEGLFSQGKEKLHYKKLQDSVNQFYGTQILDFFLTYVGNEITSATVLDPSGYKHDYVVIEYNQIEEAFNQWKLLFEEASKLHNSASRDLRTISLKSAKFQILEAPMAGILEVFPSAVFTQLKGKYLFCCNKFLVFTDSISSASFFMESYLSQQTLFSDAGYNRLTDNLSTTACYQKITNFSLLKKSSEQTPGFLYQTDSISSVSSINHISWVGLQTNRERKNLLYSNAVVQFSDQIARENKPLWKLKLDTIFYGKPKVFKNLVKNKGEIFLQDLKNTIYFIQSNGSITWKKQIAESIIGEVYPIDFYKNGKIQMLFNTRNYIWLMDRNGNQVEGFPVKLSYPSTSSISLIDYEKNKDYRLFIACSDRQVHLFDKGGKEIKDWKSPKLKSNVISKIQYYRINNRDYIIFFDSASVYILDRKGNPRIRIEKSLIPSRNGQLYYTKYQGKPCFICTSEGYIHFIYMNGKVQSKKVGEFSPDHFFLYRDFNSDGKSEFVFMDQNILNVYNEEGKVILSKVFNSPIKYEPSFLNFAGNTNALGIVLSNTHQILLLGSGGISAFGSPFDGNTQFTIDRLEKEKKGLNLLTGDEKGYLLNYFIEN